MIPAVRTHDHRRSRRGLTALISVIAIGTTLFGVTPAEAGPATQRPAVAVASPSAAAPTLMGNARNGIRQSRTIGFSRQHRPIVAYELGNPAAPFKALVLGSMHGWYERAGEQVVAALETSAVPDNLDLWVIPTINPDGDALHQRGNAAGVDLNRNFPYRWAYIAPTSSKFDSHYSGPSPLSEPESRAMYQFLTALKPARVVSLHQPLDAVDSTDGGARDIAFRTALAKNLGLRTAPLTCWSVCHGSMTGWLTHSQSGAAITVEFTQNPAASYLTGTVPRGILAALAVGVKRYVPPVVRGVVDKFSATPSGLLTAGWTYDPARTSASNSVTMTVDGKTARTAAANLTRPDVNSAFHLSGQHGFWTNLVLPKGRHTVCVTARPVSGTGSSAKQLLSCRTVTMSAPLMQGQATVPSATKAGALHVTGWAFDPLHPSDRAKVRVLVDGRTVTTTTTSNVRTDVNTAHHTTGLHGINLTITLPPGRHTVQVLALGPSTLVGDATIGQRTVVVPAA